MRKLIVWLSIGWSGLIVVIPGSPAEQPPASSAAGSIVQDHPSAGETHA